MSVSDGGGGGAGVSAVFGRISAVPTLDSGTGSVDGRGSADILVAGFASAAALVSPLAPGAGSEGGSRDGAASAGCGRFTTTWRGVSAGCCAVTLPAVGTSNSAAEAARSATKMNTAASE